jgi:hypothetical protein
MQLNVPLHIDQNVLCLIFAKIRNPCSRQNVVVSYTYFRYKAYNHKRKKASKHDEAYGEDRNITQEVND